jgi:hypothetical protein
VAGDVDTGGIGANSVCVGDGESAKSTGEALDARSVPASDMQLTNSSAVDVGVKRVAAGASTTTTTGSLSDGAREMIGLGGERSEDAENRAAEVGGEGKVL